MYTHSIDGQLSVGWDPEKGEYISQTSINQGYGAAKLSFMDVTSGRKHDVNACVNKTSAGDDFYINLNYKNSEFGQLYAKTYQKKSIQAALSELEVFGNDESNSNNLLYEFVHPIAGYLKYITGNTSLESNETVDIKKVVFDNLKNIPGLIRFDGNYDLSGERHDSNPNNYYPVVDTLRLEIDATAISSSLSDKFTLVLDFSQETCSNGVLLGVRFENLNSLGKYGTFEIKIMERDEKLSNYKISDLDINVTSEYNSNNTPYFDLSDLPILVQVGISTTNVYEKCYYARAAYSLTRSSSIQTLLNIIGDLSIPNFSNYVAEFYLQVKDNLAEGSSAHDVECVLRFKSNGGVEDAYSDNEHTSGGLFSRTYTRDYHTNQLAVSEIHIEGKEVFIKYYENWKKQPQKRNSIFSSWSNNGSASNYYKVQKFKITRDEFINEILYYMPAYVLFVPELGSQLQKTIDSFSSGDTPSLKFFEFFQIFGLGKGSLVNNKGQFTAGGNSFAAVISGTLYSIIGLNGYLNIGFDNDKFINSFELNFHFQIKIFSRLYDMATFKLSATNYKVSATNYYSTIQSELTKSRQFKNSSLSHPKNYASRPGKTTTTTNPA